MSNRVFELLNRCNEAYSKGEFYVLDIEDTMILDNILDIVVNINEEVTDQIYDTIYYAAKDKWPNDEFFNKLTSENTGFGKDIIHEIPMGSMEELKEGDFEKWSKGHEQFMISDKLDGCSLILTYIDGYLRIAATRGHGTKGKDVMRHIKYVPNIPKKINVPGKLIIRGELLFKKNRINSILTDIEQRTGKKQKNGRNTISGALNAKETNIYLFENTKFVAYWTSDKQGLAFDNLKMYGFDTPFYHILSRETLTDENMIDLVKTRLKFSDYELDGIILTQMDNIEEGFVGGTINPKCSRKFKMGIYNNEATSVVKSITWQISRWGIFTPVLNIEPVEIAGCKVSNITAHNYQNVITSKCGIGAKIKFKRAGLVIPKLEEVLKPSEKYNLPQCKTRIAGVDLVFDEDAVWYNNPDLSEFVLEKDIRALEYFGQKLEIDQLGYGNCSKLYSEYYQKYDQRLTPLNIFNLTDEFIINVIGKNGEKIVDSLKAKKSTFMEVKIAAAAGIFGPDIGERVLQLVWNKYHRLENMTSEELHTLDGFADARVNQYLKYQAEWTKAKEFLKDLIIFNDKETKQSNNLKGYVICFTGIRDKDFAMYINNNGGIATDTWKKDITHLVVKDKNSTSSKMKKAMEAGIPIITLDEIYNEVGYEFK